jgi:hypothetical protein
MPLVFRAKPIYSAGLKRVFIRDRCPKCGMPHSEYFGPRDRDEVHAELEFLRGALQTAYAILCARDAPSATAPPARRPKRARRKTSRSTGRRK